MERERCMQRRADRFVKGAWSFRREGYYSYGGALGVHILVDSKQHSSFNSILEGLCTDDGGDIKGRRAGHKIEITPLSYFFTRPKRGCARLLVRFGDFEIQPKTIEAFRTPLPSLPNNKPHAVMEHRMHHVLIVVCCNVMQGNWSWTTWK